MITHLSSSFSSVYDPANPYASYRLFLERCPVHWDGSLETWYVFRYDDVRACLKNPALSSNRFTPAYERLSPAWRRELEPLARSATRWLFSLDGADHGRMRALFTRAFTAALERTDVDGELESIARQLLETARTRSERELELVEQYSAPFPILFISKLVGFDPKDHQRVKAWYRDLNGIFAFRVFDFEVFLRAQRAVVEITEYLRERWHARQRSPEADMLSELCAAQEASGFSVDEVLASFVFFIGASHETTSNLIANAVLTVLKTPGALDRFKDPATDKDAFVEELLRFEPSIQRISRIATDDVVIGAAKVSKGQKVSLCLGAANRDPARFEHPDTFDPSRNPNRHLSFGFGPHYCIGAALARRQIKIGLQMLLEMCPGLKMNPGPLQWAESFGLRSVARLPLSFDSLRTRPAA